MKSPYKYNTQVGEIEKRYKIRIGVNPKTKLGDFLKKRGYPSLAGMLK